jgi:hypothetical protein
MNSIITTLVYVLRNNFSHKSLLAKSDLSIGNYGLRVNNTIIPYETDCIELLEDWEVGQYLGGN